MAKLYFRYGAVSSAKTLNLLAVAHNYERQGKRVLVYKPAFDTRFGAHTVASRAGLDRQADDLLTDESRLEASDYRDVHCVLVDEAQFLSAALVDQLRLLTRSANVPVICYGLRTDFRSRLFDGSRRLFEIADTIEEIKTTCTWCNRKAVLNLKSIDGQPTLAGPSKELGTEERYLPVCFQHYTEKLGLDDSESFTKATSGEGA